MARVPSKVINLGLEEGMSSNYIVDITQDKYGFLWFATEYGVNRFDGTKFTVYMKNDKTHLKSNNINRIEADTLHNEVWISSRRSGLSVFNGDTDQFTSFMHDKNNLHSIATNDLSDLLVTTQGEVWIATYHNGLEHYNRESGQFEHYNTSTVPGLPSNKVLSISENQDGNIYVGHQGAGLTLFSPNGVALQNYQHIAGEKHSLPNNDVTCTYTDRYSNIWVGTHAGLSLFDPLSGTFHNFREILGIHSSITNTINTINQSTDGRIWVGTVSDICIFDPNEIDRIFSGTVVVESTPIKNIHTGLSNPTILSIFRDSFSNLWIGTNGGGVGFINQTPSFFSTWQDASLSNTVNGLSDKDACAIVLDADHKIWVGTDGGGINVYEKDRNIKVYRKEKDDIFSDAIFSAFKDSNDNLWFGGFSGLSIYNWNDRAFMQSGVPAIRQRANCFFEESSKTLWIGTSGGLYSCSLQTEKEYLLRSSNESLQRCDIASIAQDNKGRLWLGTLNSGLILLNTSNEEPSVYNSENGFPYDIVRCIYKDTQNRMWAATDEGLILFPSGDPSNYILYATENGLACSSIRAIEEDQEGNLWLSTNFGISCFLESENKFLNYNYTDGTLVGNFMNGAVAKAPDGTLYFGSQNGVCYFNPKNRPDRSTLPSVVFTEFKVHEQQTSLHTEELLLPVSTQKVSLRHTQNTFTVSFRTMNYGQQGQVEYLYNLEGLSDTWFNLGDLNSATFQNIPYKHYTLKVKARLKNHQWSDEYSSLDILIHPPLWLTWWAKTLYTLIGIGIVLFIISSYKKRLKLKNTLILEKESIQAQKELNEERLRFYTNITHELRSPLTLIVGPLEDLQNDPQLFQDHKKKLSLIQQSADRLLNLVTQILEFRKTETQNRKLCVASGDLSIVIQEIGLKYKESYTHTGIEFNIRIETPKTEFRFDREALTIIVDNLLSNAFKHTTKGQITLTVRSVRENDLEFTEIEVRDTGTGMEQADLPRIFERYYQSTGKKHAPGFGIGLSLVANLVKLHQGSISVQSEPDRGSCFCVRLLTNNTYPNAIHAEEKKKEESTSDSHNKPIVLVVEDDNNIRDYIAQSLMKHYDVIVSDNGQSGVDIAFEYIPDIIISDVMMPVKDGIELCRELKEDVRTSHIPILLLTAKDTMQDKTEGYNAGADSYVTKPFSATLLHSRIVNLLEARKRITTLVNSNKFLKQSIVQESLNKLDNDFLDRLVQVIEEHLEEENIDASTLAQEMSMSYSSLYRKIKALTGMSINEFIRKIKIRKAEQLLLSGQYSISEVSFRIGLNSTSYFRECFKKEYGVNPSEYLKTIRPPKQ